MERVIKGEEVILNGGEACRESGEIWIAPDFDQLSDDMAEAFGLRRQNADQSTLILASVLIRIRVAHIGFAYIQSLFATASPVLSSRPGNEQSTARRSRRDTDQACERQIHSSVWNADFVSTKRPLFIPGVGRCAGQGSANATFRG